MKVVVCIRQSADGEINPFDASGLETALRIEGAEVILLSMGPEKTKAFLERLTRLGAEKGVLLTDKAFAGADTLATAYTLSLAVNRLKPDLVICGRQSVDGDTGQVGPSLAVNTGYNLITNVMSLFFDGGLCSAMRNGETERIVFPSVITVEKSLNLRLPSIRSKQKEVEVLSAADLSADISRTGLVGSPTRVIKTFQNDTDRRKCKFITPEEIFWAINDGLNKGEKKLAPAKISEKRLKNVWIVGESPRPMAEAVADNITVISLKEPQAMAEEIKNGAPDALLWGSDPLSKAVAPQVAAILRTGLCADCTSLETDGEVLYMYRPACSGNIIAKIKCITSPAMATVRTAEVAAERIIIGIGYGAREHIKDIEDVALRLNAGLAATRKTVDNDYLPYDIQVGLTGKTVNPEVYISLGVSGAVHHIAGMRGSGTVIAVNTDRDAPIFDYADYGITADVKTVIENLLAK